MICQRLGFAQPQTVLTGAPVRHFRMPGHTRDAFKGGLMNDTTRSALVSCEMQTARQALENLVKARAALNVSAKAGLLEINISPELAAHYIELHGDKGRYDLEVLTGRRDTIASVNTKIFMRLEDPVDTGALEQIVESSSCKLFMRHDGLPAPLASGYQQPEPIHERSFASRLMRRARSLLGC